ncbi:hypothetical protein [Shimia sediminis]|uniref:hypothetical protein n=1 Tax=Shimia sediminis TaxID=2497945 RepID=UPI000F8DB3FB|nr:hypothetical protein [Shimia sediminis]
MQRRELVRLSKAMEADFLSAQMRFRQIIAEENRLRTMLRDLDSQERESRRQLHSDVGLKSFGGDIAWYRWVSLSRERLNTQLAKVLAKKSESESVFREKGGKSAAIDTVSQKQQENARRRRGVLELRTLETLHILKSRSR